MNTKTRGATRCLRHPSEEMAIHQERGHKRRRCPACMLEALVENRPRYRELERERYYRRPPKKKRFPEVKDPNYVRRQNAIQSAIRNGTLIPQDCERCGRCATDKDAAGRRLVYASQRDAASPIEWLCARCVGVRRQTISPEPWQKEHT